MLDTLFQGFRTPHASSYFAFKTCPVSCRKCDPKKGTAAKSGQSASTEHSPDAAASISPASEQSEGSTSTAEPQAGSKSSAGSATAGDLGSEQSEGSTSTAEPQAGSDGMQTQYDLLSQPGDTMWLLPELPASYFAGVESLSRLSAGEDKYLIPPEGFGAIDSIAIVGNMAYLFQITQNPRHEINEFLAVVLAYLPEHLQVEFIWVLPLHMWKEGKFKQRQLPDLKAYLSKLQAKTSSSSAEQKEGVKEATRQQRHKQMVADKESLVAKRLQACEGQYQLGLVPVTESMTEQPKQLKQTAAEASLRTVVGFGRAAVSSVRCLSQVKVLPLAVH